MSAGALGVFQLWLKLQVSPVLAGEAGAKKL
jgi:hypothetical protein